MTPGPGIEPGTHWWEASALTTAVIQFREARRSTKTQHDYWIMTIVFKLLIWHLCNHEQNRAIKGPKGSSYSFAKIMQMFFQKSFPLGRLKLELQSPFTFIVRWTFFFPMKTQVLSFSCQYRKESNTLKLNSTCSLLEDKNTVPPSVTAIPMRPGIFEIVLSFNRPLTWQRWIHEPFSSPTNRYCSSRFKANEVNKLDRSKENNLFNCPTQLVSSSSLTQEIEKEGKRSRKVSYFVPRKQILRELKQILQYKWG